MQETFLEDLNIIKSNRVKHLVELEKAIKKVSSYTCRGEINLLNKSSNIPILQTHYEYFIISILDGMIKVSGCDSLGKETLNKTMIYNFDITRYYVSDTCLTLEGNLSEELIMRITIVFKEKIKK
ncbi:hypothetical protein [Clostridium senegalense]|uniref:hypothetical protein n=1 Tax=Clostridium senegalense TaxID=1465809 RepID=UPI000289117E|nr:hypothetical protein [Clostridium senegalense]